MAKLNLGAVTAYADAVAAGFTGTREEFGEWLANAGKNAAEVAANLEESKKVLSDVNDAGTAQVKAVQDEGAVQIGNVEDAAEAKKKEIAELDAVQFTEQDKTDAEKMQARKNIDAASAEKVDELSEAIADLANTKADAIVESAAGEVIAVSDSAEAPLRGLVVYGKSTQDGTPSPDAPVPIVSVGDDGVTEVRVGGRNFVDLADKTTNGAAYVYERKKIYVAPGVYTFSCEHNVPEGIAWFVTFYNESGTNIKGTGYLNANVRKATIELGEPAKYISIYVNSAVTMTNIMLNAGETALPYEPYTAQSLRISTPGGLPGIPVSSGGNYTDGDGRKWICDRWSNEKSVKNTVTIVFDGTEEGWQKNAEVNSFSIGSSAYSGLGAADVFGAGYTRGVCSHFIVKTYTDGSANMTDKTMDYFTGAAGKTVRFKHNGVSSVDEWKAYLKAQYAAGTPLTIIMARTTPIETPLSETDLAAYRALRTNYPNTTIYADDSAGISVEYAADTKKYIDKKFAELSAAIING